MNLILIGYRGTGKSTIGRSVAEKLGLRYVGLDAEIVRKAGMPIPEIVAKHSWQHFRDLEEEVTAEAAAGDRQLIDTGGGVVTRPVNIERLRKAGPICLLEADIPDILTRIGADTQRPSLTGTKSFTEEVVDVLNERLPLYRGAADFTVNTSALSIEEAVSIICAKFNNWPA